MTNIYDIAEKAGVSVATVSRVLNNIDKVSPRTAKKVKQVIAETGYRPNHAARTLTTKRSNMIGMVISDITNPFYPAVARGIQDVCLDAGYNVMMCNTDENPHLLKEYITELCHKQAEGLIIQTLFPQDLNVLQIARKASIEVVLISDPGTLEASAVFTDDAKAASIATNHLINIGHHQLGFFGGSRSLQVNKKRFSGFKNALKESGIGLNSDYILFDSFSLVGGARMAETVTKLENLPSAIFAANDLIAIGAIQWFQENGIQVPNDIAVIGFDDIDLGRYIRPRLSTIANPKYELGQTAGELLLSRIEDPQQPHRQVVLDTRLVIRESSLTKESTLFE